MSKVLVQIFLSLILIVIIFYISKKYFYTENKIKNVKESLSLSNEKDSLQNKKIKNKSTDNEIVNLTYQKFDTNGNKYLIKAKKGILDNNKPNIVNMRIVEASLTYLNNEKMVIYSKEAIFNKQNFKTTFSNNVKVIYQKQTLESDSLEFLIDKNIAIFKDNVKYYNQKIEAFGEIVIINLLTREIDIKSKNQKKVKIKTKN